MASTRTVDKRGRGQIACAECKRMKIKCDKQIPCSSCIRRGCSVVCPNQTLSAGQGTRFILADTADLHDQISKMSRRIRQLEDALAVLQATVSNDTHPLLAESVEFDAEVTPDTIKQTDAEEAEGSVIEVLGTLSISDSGVPKYYGPSAAGFENILLESQHLEKEPTFLDFPILPQEILEQSKAFAIGWCQELTSNPMQFLEDALPPYPRACSLLEIYIEHLSWYSRPLTREDVIEDLFTPFYKNKSDARRRPHNLAVLYFLFANVALFDLTLPPYNEEAESYYHLGRAALSLQCIFSEVEMPTVEAVAWMGLYHSLSGHRHSLESAWNLISLASKIGQQIGLHRDPAQFNLPHKMVQRRRRVFWDLCIQDILCSLALGRPPAASLSHLDCEFPVDEEHTVDANGNVQLSFWYWRCWYARRLYLVLLDSAFSAKPMTYEAVLKMDREIRKMKLPSVYDEEIVPGKPMQHLQRYVTHHYHPIAMIYLHRNYFAESLIKFPKDPLQSPYAHSTLAAYRYASAAIKICVDHHKNYEALFDRVWTFWTQIFSASVVVGTIAAKAPRSNMAQNAFKEMCVGLELLEQGASKHVRAKAAADIVRGLKERAVKALLQGRTGVPPFINLSTLGREEEVDAWAGNAPITRPSPPLTYITHDRPQSDGGGGPVDQFSFPLEFLPRDYSVFNDASLTTNSSIPSDFQIAELDSVLSSFIVGQPTYTDLGISTGELEASDFTMGEAVQNDQWTSLLQGFGIGGDNFQF